MFTQTGTVEIKENNNNLRFLRSITVENGSYVPNESGYISITIIFIKILINLNEIFKNSQELIKVDLSKLEMKNVISMNSTFSGCINLDEINLKGINTISLLDMTYTFEKCSKLKIINLSPINTDNLRNSKGLFSKCDNLEIINISSFKKIYEDIFDGIQSKPNIIANKYTSTLISNIFFNFFYININVTIIEDNNKTNNIKQCIIGQNEKCKECNDAIPGNCLYCNKGYYLPFNEIKIVKCLSCNRIENCSTCFWNIYYIVCSSCEEDFYLHNNRCIKSKKEKCLIGENEKCSSCKIEIGRETECKTCNEGYYLSELTNKTKCLNYNNIENCIDCKEVNNNSICNKFKNRYKVINNLCVEEECQIGENEKCSFVKLK